MAASPSIAVPYPGIAPDFTWLRQAVQPLMLLVVVGLFATLIASHRAEATGCEASPSQIAAMLDEMARLQGADRLG